MCPEIIAVVEELVVPVILITDIPADLLCNANGDAGERRLEFHRESLGRLEGRKGGANLCPKRIVPTVARVLNMAVANVQVSAFCEREARAERGGVQVADIQRLLAGDKLAARDEIINPTGGVQVELRIARVESEPLARRPGSVGRVRPGMRRKTRDRDRIGVVVRAGIRGEEERLYLV